MSTNLAHCAIPLVAAALGLVSCSRGLDVAADRPAPATHTVSIEGTSFQPAMLTVKVGDSVVWVNKDPFPHTATSRAGGFDSSVILPDQSWSYTPTAKGEFAYVCTLHLTMTGMLRVE